MNLGTGVTGGGGDRKMSWEMVGGETTPDEEIQRKRRRELITRGPWEAFRAGPKGKHSWERREKQEQWGPSKLEWG